jgi:hypothetical protein
LKRVQVEIAHQGISLARLTRTRKGSKYRVCGKAAKNNRNDTRLCPWAGRRASDPHNVKASALIN